MDKPKSIPIPGKPSETRPGYTKGREETSAPIQGDGVKGNPFAAYVGFLALKETTSDQAVAEMRDRDET